MSTELTLFDGDGALTVPDYLKDQVGSGSLANEGARVPSLGYTGKVFTVYKDGEETRIMRRDEDGDEIPRSSIKVIVLGFNPNRGRTYYKGTYDPDAVSAPICWSADGQKPDASIAEPQHPNCAQCPMAVKGSRVSDNGKEVAACGQHRMLAVVPVGALGLGALRMKIAVTSDYDKQRDKQERFQAFKQFRQFLAAKNVADTSWVVTTIKFDPDQAYPKLLFSPVRPITEEESNEVKKILASGVVPELLSENWTPAQSTEMASTPDDDDDDDDDAPASKATKAAVAPVADEPDDDDDDDDETIVVPTKAASKGRKAAKPAESAKAPPATAANAELDALLSAWGD